MNENERADAASEPDRIGPNGAGSQSTPPPSTARATEALPPVTSAPVHHVGETQPFAPSPSTEPIPVPPAWAVPSPANVRGPDPSPDQRAATGPVATPATIGVPGPVDGLGPTSVGPAHHPAGRRAGPVLRRPVVLTLGGLAAAVLLVGAGFLAGTAVHHGDSTSLTSAGAASGQGPGGQVPGQGGQAGPGGRAFGDPDGDGDAGPGQGSSAARDVVVGRVSAVDGTTLTVATTDGGTAKVTTTSSTVVGGTAGGDLSALAVGQIVFVAGTTADDGSISATAIMTRRGRFGPGARGQQGQQGQQGGSAPAGGTT